MKIGIASDHRGFKLKQEATKFLKELGYNVVDYGTNSEEMVDYPLYAIKIGEEVRDKNIDFGILICGTGIGMSIMCNKIKCVKCARVVSVNDAYYSRLHNDANVIALSEDNKDYKEILKTFITTEFSNVERYKKRNEMVDNYDN